MKKFNIKSLIASAMITATICTTTCAAPMTTSASIHLDFWNKYYKDVTVVWCQYRVGINPVDVYAVTAYNDDYLWQGDVNGGFLKDMLGLWSVDSNGYKFDKDIRSDYLDNSAFSCSVFLH